MINWYIILYLGIILILYLFPYIASFPPLADYIESRLGLAGLSRGTNLLLSRLISGDLLSLTMISVIACGILGGLGFAFIILISLSIFILVVQKLKQKETTPSITELLDQQTKGFSYWYNILLLLGVNLGNMILQLTALKTLLGGYFAESGLLVVFFVSAFSFVYAGLGGFDAISKGVRPQIIVIFLSTAVITVSIFLENGLAATYSHLVTAPLLDFTITKAVLLALAGMIIMTTQYLLDHSLWHTALRLKPQSRPSILFLTVFCVLAITLSFSAIAVYGLTQGLQTVESLIEVLENNNAVILLNLYIVMIFIAVISSYALNLHSAVAIYLGWGKNGRRANGTDIKKGYGFALFFSCLAASVFLLLNKLPLLDLLVILGSIYASLAIPFLSTLFRLSRPGGIGDYAGILMLIGGSAVLIRDASPYTPVICLAGGILLQLLILISAKIRNKFIKRG